MKILLLTVLVASFSYPLQAKEVFEIKIFGKLMFPKPEDMKNLNSLIGNMVSQEKLKRFEITDYGFEGGYRACIEPSPDSTATEIFTTLKSFKVDESLTSYLVTKVVFCK